MKSPMFYSSFLFSLPAFYAYEKGAPFYFYNLLLTTFLSANYWYDPVIGLRKYMDVLHATSTFVYFFYKGSKHVKNIENAMVGYSGALVCIGSYACSHYYYSKKRPYWVYYHLLFHLSAMGLQFYVVNLLTQTASSKQIRPIVML